MVPEIWKHVYNQRIHDFELISTVQIRIRGQLIEVFTYLKIFINTMARGLSDYDPNDRAMNNEEKLILKN